MTRLLVSSARSSAAGPLGYTKGRSEGYEETTRRTVPSMARALR